MVVSAGKVYSSGNYYQTASIPLFWTDTVWTELPTVGGKNSGYAYSNCVEGDTLYTAGKYYNGVGWIACYWENDNRFDLPGGSGTAYANFVDAGTVYTAGEYFTGNSWRPCYWINTTRSELTFLGSGSSAYATSIFVRNGDIYIAGSCLSWGTWVPLYWKNGSFNELPCDGSGGDGYATDIFVSDLVYISGYYFNGSV